jgi:Domain of unknown function (DUF5069)
MEPLDLTQRPPRPTREKLCGAYFLARTIDKLRSEVPGGNPGPYVNEDRGFSAYVVRRLGLDMDEFREAVARAATESEVVAWLQERVDPAAAEALNTKMETFVASRMTPEDLELIRRRHPVMGQRPDLDRVLDILDAEDVRAFAAASR